MSEPHTVQRVLGDFCHHWNRRGLYPTLYPVHLVPQSFAEDVAKAQVEGLDADTMALPDDMQSADQVIAWLRGHEVHDKSRVDVRAIQLAVVDRRHRIGVLDLNISFGDQGVHDTLTRIKVFTMLAGFSRRSTWIDPSQLSVLDRYDKSDVNNYLVAQVEERVKLFQKALQSMIKAKIKDVEGKIARKDQAIEQKDRLQALIEALETEGVPVGQMMVDKRLHTDVSQGMGVIEVKTKGISCTLTTEATQQERNAFSAMIKRLGEKA